MHKDGEAAGQICVIDNEVSAVSRADDTTANVHGRRLLACHAGLRRLIAPARPINLRGGLSLQVDGLHLTLRSRHGPSRSRHS